MSKSQEQKPKGLDLDKNTKGIDDNKKSSSTFSNSINTKSKKIFIPIALIMLIAVTITGLVFYINNKNNSKNDKYALIIEDTKISKEKYNELITQAKKNNVDEQKAKKTIISVEKSKIAAKSLNVSWNDDDINKVMVHIVDTDSLNNPSDWQKLLATQNVIDQKIEQLSKEGYEGYFFSFPFSKNFLDSDKNTTNPKFKNIEAIQQDKDYAKLKAESIKKRITEKSLSYDDAVKEILADNNLIYGNSRNKTSKFSIDKKGFSEISTGVSSNIASLYLNDLSKLKNGELSEIKTESQRYREIQSGQILNNETSYYFVVKTNDRGSDKNLKNNFNNLINQIKVVENV